MIRTARAIVESARGGDVRSAPRRRLPARLRVAAQAVLTVVIAGALITGVLMRLWYLRHDPIDADEALVGILARHILAGHTNAFLLGQRYGGVEPYLVAFAFALGGSTPLVLQLPVVALSALGCVLVWRVGLRLLRRPAIAVAAAAAMWVAPQSVVWNSTLEYGFRGVTLVCGLAMLLLALRVTQGSAARWELPALGLVAGIGWWSSPEIVYFALPAALWLLVWGWRMRSAWRMEAAAGGAAVLTAGLGALPWLWDNVTTGFASLRVAQFDAPTAPPPLLGRLGIFFRDVVLVVMDLRTPRSGAWDVPSALGAAMAVFMGAVVAGAGIWCVVRRTKGAALGVAVLAYPFFMAAVPASAAWQSGRYTNFFVPLALLLVAAALDDVLSWSAERSPAPARPEPRAVARRNRRRLAGAASLGVAVSLTVVVALSVVSFGALARINDPPAARLSSGNPEGPAEALVASLERRGVTTGYADYWVAYTLDFLSKGRLSITDAPPSPDRLPAVMSAVRSAPARRQAWIFVPPTPTARAEYADTPVIQGPAGLSEAAFLADVARLGISCRVQGFSGAEVSVCSRPVTFADIGLPT